MGLILIKNGWILGAPRHLLFGSAGLFTSDGAVPIGKCSCLLPITWVDENVSTLRLPELEKQTVSLPAPRSRGWGQTMKKRSMVLC